MWRKAGSKLSEFRVKVIWEEATMSFSLIIFLIWSHKTRRWFSFALNDERFLNESLSVWVSCQVCRCSSAQKRWRWGKVGWLGECVWWSGAVDSLTLLDLVQDAHQVVVAPDLVGFDERRDDDGDHGHRLQGRSVLSSACIVAIHHKMAALGQTFNSCKIYFNVRCI